MDWANKFYSTTGKWWGPAEAKITQRYYLRASTIKKLGSNVQSVLELGCSYGNTAAACAEKGFNVTAIELSDRIDFSKEFEKKKYSGSLKFIRGSFYDIEIDNKFDCVTYWNGLGIGTDFDQRKLLKRIARWLKPGGIALVDVQNPFVWAKWALENEDINKRARPEAGYHYNVSEKISFDPLKNRFTDTWWETEIPKEKIIQDLRCYSPHDFQLLLESTGLQLDFIEVDGKKIDLNALVDISDNNPLFDASEYLAKLIKV